MAVSPDFSRGFYTRRGLVLTAVSFASCARRDASRPSLPTTLEGWRLIQSGPLEPSAAPEQVRQQGVISGVRGTYEGARPLLVTVFRMRGSSAAFEAVQKWRPVPSSIAFHQGALFIVVESQGASNPELNAIGKSLEKVLHE